MLIPRITTLHNAIVNQVQNNDNSGDMHAQQQTTESIHLYLGPYNVTVLCAMLP